MTLRLPHTRRPYRGLGDTTQDGTTTTPSPTAPSSPCGAWDYVIGPSTACCNYLQSTNPNSLIYQWDCPQAPSIASQVGSTAGQIAGSAAGAAVASAASAVTANPSNNLLMYGALAVAAVVLVLSLKK